MPSVVSRWQSVSSKYFCAASDRKLLTVQGVRSASRVTARSPAFVAMVASTVPFASGSSAGASTSFAPDCESAGYEQVPAAAEESDSAAEPLESPSESDDPHPLSSRRAKTAKAASASTTAECGRRVRA